MSDERWTGASRGAAEHERVHVLGVALVDLTDEELAARRPAMVAGFAADVAENFGVPLAIAAEVADRQLRTILPDGVGTGLSVPGAEPARAFADALGLPLVSQQMIKDL